MNVKICGITNLEDALAACEYGADALGFNFAPEAKKRNRYIDPDDAVGIIEQLPPFIVTVAVTVNESPERLLEYLEIVDRVQLHGEESPTECEVIGARAIKAFRAGPDFDPRTMLDYPVSAYLLDAYVPDSRGGTGRTCDWTIARKAVEYASPLILAGGLTPENVADAVQTVRPYGVDTASGVESEPGRKDHEHMRHFIANAKTPGS